MKFTTLQKLCNHLIDNVDQVLLEQKEVAGKIEQVFQKYALKGFIKNILEKQKELKGYLNLNAKEFNYTIIINPNLPVLPNAYKYSKNYVYLMINHENGKFTYSFNRSYYYSKEKIRDYFFKGKLTVLEQNLLEVILNTRTE